MTPKRQIRVLIPKHQHKVLDVGYRVVIRDGAQDEAVVVITRPPFTICLGGHMQGEAHLLWEG